MNFTDLLSVALQKAGKNETLATALDLSPSGLSRRINNEIGWNEKDINCLITYSDFEICDTKQYLKQIATLKDAMKILLNGDNNGC